MCLLMLSYVFQYLLNYNWKINVYRLIKEKDFYIVYVSVVLCVKFCSRDFFLFVLFIKWLKREYCVG